jgi:VWFA-related protein
MAILIRWAAATVLSLGLALPLWAQETPTSTQPQVFGESIDVRVVNVEAVVTGRGGERVRGLTAGDFRLLVDGKEVPVDYFAEVAEGAAVTASGDGAPVSQGEEVGRSYLVFIDDSISLAPQRDDLLTKLKLDLNLLRPADRMAVLAFDGLHIDVLSPWTSDTAALAAALDRARQRPASGAMAKVHLRAPESEVTLIEDSAATLDDGDGKGPSIVGTELATLHSRPTAMSEAFTDAHKAADAAAAALRAFEAPAGRKVMLLVSGAWTLQSAARFYGPMLGAANRLGYSVYPVDSAQSQTSAIKTADVLARLTGGTAVAPLDNRVLREVVRDTGTYYWLGFSPSWKANDQSHRVTVEVRRSGLTVRSRLGFSDLSKASESALRTESVLLFGGREQERRLFVKLGTPHRRGRELEVPVTLGVPFEALAMTPQGKVYLAEVPLALAAMDEKGGRADLRARLKVAVPTLPQAGNYVRFQTVVRVRNVGQRLVFTVPDLASGGTVWGEANLALTR